VSSSHQRISSPRSLAHPHPFLPLPFDFEGSFGGVHRRHSAFAKCLADLLFDRNRDTAARLTHTTCCPFQYRTMSSEVRVETISSGVMQVFSESALMVSGSSPAS